MCDAKSPTDRDHDFENETSTKIEGMKKSIRQVLQKRMVSTDVYWYMISFIPNEICVSCGEVNTGEGSEEGGVNNCMTCVRQLSIASNPYSDIYDLGLDCPGCWLGIRDKCLCWRVRRATTLDGMERLCMNKFIATCADRKYLSGFCLY
jgi:hypothetical protein